MFALDENLVGHAKLFRNLKHEVVELISLVNVHADSVLAALQSLAQCRNSQRVSCHAMSPLQPHRLELRKRVVAHESSAGETAVDCGVMREHEHAVFRELEVKLHDVCSHADDGLYCRNRIFRIVPPVAPVNGHNDISRVRIVDFGENLVRPFRILRLTRSA